MSKKPPQPAKKPAAKKPAARRATARRPAPQPCIDVIDQCLTERLRDTDDLMMDILRANDRLNAGEITVEQARALTGNFKSLIKIISHELDAAKHTGRMEKTLRRWFTRVHESSTEGRSISCDVLAELRELVKRETGKGTAHSRHSN